jgi:hypothetical protein
MTSKSGAVMATAPSDAEQAIAVVALAFSTDPAARWSYPVVCENSAQGLRGLAVVELEHAAEPLTAFQRACSDHLCLGRDELVAEALVRAFLMVMVHELWNGSPEVLLAERDDSLPALGLGG